MNSHNVYSCFFFSVKKKLAITTNELLVLLNAKYFIKLHKIVCYVCFEPLVISVFRNIISDTHTHIQY